MSTDPGLYRGLPVRDCRVLSEQSRGSPVDTGQGRGVLHGQQCRVVDKPHCRGVVGFAHDLGPFPAGAKLRRCRLKADLSTAPARPRGVLGDLAIGAGDGEVRAGTVGSAGGS